MRHSGHYRDLRSASGGGQDSGCRGDLRNQEEAACPGPGPLARLHFQEDFEGDAPHEFVQWYGGTAPWTLRGRACSEEEALSGMRSFTPERIESPRRLSTRQSTGSGRLMGP